MPVVIGVYNGNLVPGDIDGPPAPGVTNMVDWPSSFGVGRQAHNQSPLKKKSWETYAAPAEVRLSGIDNRQWKRLMR